MRAGVQGPAAEHRGGSGAEGAAAGDWGEHRDGHGAAAAPHDRLRHLPAAPQPTLAGALVIALCLLAMIYGCIAVLGVFILCHRALCLEPLWDFARRTDATVVRL